MDNLPANPNSRPIWPPLSPELKWLLGGDLGDEAAERRIGTNPVLRAEAASVLPALKALATDRARDDGVREVIGRRFALYPQPQRSQEEWAAWWSDYYATLSEVPLCALEAAMAAWIAAPDSEFLPKPGRLLSMAMSGVSVPAIVAYGVARGASAYRDVTPPPPRPEPTPEEVEASRRQTDADQQRIRRWADEFSRSIAARSPPVRERSFPQGKVDGTGVTPQLRVLMARQRAEEAERLSE